MSETEPRDDALPLVAVIGRPNVGKSTLFNRIVGRRLALMQDEPGVTRDRRYATADWSGTAFRLVDTGGFELEACADLAVSVQRQVRAALREAALVLLVIDARAGIGPADQEIARELRRLNKTVLVVANKVDDAKSEPLGADAYTLGFAGVFPLSAEHGRGTGELLDAVLAALPAATHETIQPEKSVLRLALVGKPNAGKSSLLNRILGEERVVVDDEPGTTRDPVDTPLVFEGQDFLLVDTAGIRKKRMAYQPTERVAVQMALDVIRRSELVCLVIDASTGPSEQDAKLAGMIAETGRGLICVATKVDLLDEAGHKRLQVQLSDELRHVDWAPRLLVSAKTGLHVPELLQRAKIVYRRFRAHMATGELNRFLEEILSHHPPPLWRGKPVRIYYISQPETGPPLFVLKANHPETLSPAYRRYLIHALRERFDLEGTPVRLLCRRRQ